MGRGIICLYETVDQNHMTKARRPAYSAGYGGLPPHAFSYM
jgi:hypothetical protein